MKTRLYARGGLKLGVVRRYLSTRALIPAPLVFALAVNARILSSPRPLSSSRCFAGGSRNRPTGVKKWDGLNLLRYPDRFSILPIIARYPWYPPSEIQICRICRVNFVRI